MITFILCYLGINGAFVLALWRLAERRERRDTIARRLRPDNVVQLRKDQIYRGR